MVFLCRAISGDDTGSYKKMASFGDDGTAVIFHRTVLISVHDWWIHEYVYTLWLDIWIIFVLDHELDNLLPTCY